MKRKNDIKLIASKGTETVYANNVKTFLKIAENYDFSECGVAFVGKDQVETLVKCDSLDDTVKRYQRVVDMIEVDEAEKLKIAKNLIQKLKEDAIDFKSSTFATFIAFGFLFGKDDLKYWSFLTILLLLNSVNLVEAFSIIRKAISKHEDRVQIEEDLRSFGILSYASNCEQEEDLSLYLKLSDGFLKRKK